MIRKRILYAGYLLASMAMAAISTLVEAVVYVVDGGFRYLSTLDTRAEQFFVGIVQSLKTSFSDRWRSAKAFKEDALTHDKFDGNQFTDVCSPSLQC